jgi:uncharacterized protein YjbI with pentapeptide repeats
MSNATDSWELCGQFLIQSAAQRLEILQSLGLERYRQLLCQLPISAANQRCLLTFLTAPTTVKFPQLIGANLQGLQLQGMNLIRGNFTAAQLQGCNLMFADLLFANFTDADLSHADLRDCTLHQTCWVGSIVVGCDLRGAKGLTGQQQQLLLAGGAILS